MSRCGGRRSSSCWAKCPPRPGAWGSRRTGFSGLLDAYWNGTDLRQLRLAVVDHEEEAYVFSRELELRMQGVRARSVSLGEVESEAARALLSGSEFLLTTSYHLEEVRELSRRFGKKLVEIKPSHEIYREVLSAARHENVAIVVRDEDTLHASWDVFMNIYHPSTEMKFWIAPISRQDLIEKIVRDADLIFVSPCAGTRCGSGRRPRRR